jgi:hypothetical protein
MSDYDTSLPVRTQNDGDVKTKLVGLTTANIAEVNASNEQLVHDASALAKLTTINTALTTGPVPVAATALDIRPLVDTTDSVKVGNGSNFMGVNPDGSINVNVQSSALSSTEQHKYNSTVAGVPGTPNDTVSYTVTAGKTFIIKQWAASGSGKFKAQLSVNAVIVDTQFNSTSEPNVERTISSPIEVPAGQVIKVIMTNRDVANQDLYAFINGNEV